MSCELSARIVPGDARCLQYRNAVSQSCRTCRPYAEFIPVMQLPDEVRKVKQSGNKSNPARRGVVFTPAADLAAKYFDSINSHLDAGGSWSAISNLIKQATGAVFDVKSLHRYFDAETVKRGLPIRKLLRGCPKSRAKRLGL